MHGSPLRLADTAKHGESLAGLNDTELFQRLFQQQKGPNVELLDAAKACSLVYSFDGETLEGADSELLVLAKLAGQTVDQLYRNVAELQRRQLAQKRSKWRAILPHALANRLAKRALEDIPLMRIEDALVNGASLRLLRSFSRRVGYLHGVGAAVTLVWKWFAADGLLAALGQYPLSQEQIFENVAPVDPGATLASVEKAAATHSSWFFTAQNGNAALIFRILRSLAYDPVLFSHCVAILKRFPLGGRPAGGDSVLDVLRSLFWIKLSGTHATVAQRAQFVESLLNSDSGEERELGLSLLDAMLETSNFHPHHSFEFGAWNRDLGWYPKTEREVRDWYTRVLQIVRNAETFGKLGPDSVRHVMTSHVTGLLETGMVDEVMACAKHLTETATWPEGWIGARKAVRQATMHTTAANLQKLQELEEYLRPEDLTSSVRAFALSTEWTALDIADLEDEDGTASLEARQHVYAKCTELGRQLAANATVLDGLLSEILASDSQKTYALGQGLAAGCVSLGECWRSLIVRFLEIPVEKRHAQLLSGFLNGGMARSQTDTEGLLGSAWEDVALHPYLIEWQVSAGIRGAAFERMMRALTFDTVSISSFTLLKFARAHEGLSDEQFSELLQSMMRSSKGTLIAAGILGMRIFGRRADKLPISESLRALGREFLSKVNIEDSSEHDHTIGSVVSVALHKPEHESEARGPLHENHGRDRELEGPFVGVGRDHRSPDEGIS
jgi:hypothetical protein